MPTCKQIILQDSCMYVVLYCSLAKSGRLSCVARSWEFRFAMLTSTKTIYWALLPLELSKMCFNDRLLSLRKIAVLLHEVTAGKLPLIVLPASCIISCVKPYSVPRSCVPAFTVAPPGVVTWCAHAFSGTHESHFYNNQTTASLV